jgi:hypothetical protein
MRTPLTLSACVGALILAALTAPHAASAPAAPKPADPDAFTLHTVALREPVGARARRITLSGKLGGAATLSLDPNSFFLGPTGDIQGGTLIGFFPVKVQLKERPDLTKGDPANRRAFDLVSEKDLKPAMRLVWTPPTFGPHRLLILGEKDEVVRVIPLEGDEPRGEKPAGDKVALTTVYQPGGGRMQVTGTLGGEGTLIIDPNRATFSPLGDVAGATKIAVRSVPVKLKPVPAAGKDARPPQELYEVAGAPDARLRLVIGPTAAGPHRLLTLDEQGRVVGVQTLEPIR